MSVRVSKVIMEALNYPNLNTTLVSVRGGAISHVCNLGQFKYNSRVGSRNQLTVSLEARILFKYNSCVGSSLRLGIKLSEIGSFKYNSCVGSRGLLEEE